MTDATTLKLDGELLADLKTVADNAYRSPQKHLRMMVDRELGALQATSKASAEDIAERRNIVRRVQASEALEGYEPITDPRFVAMQENGSAAK